MGGHSPCYPRCFRATSSFCSTTVHAGSRARYNGQRTAACHGRGHVCMRRKKGCRPPHTFCAAGTTAACAPEGCRGRELGGRRGIHAKKTCRMTRQGGVFILWSRRRDLNPQPADDKSEKWLFPGISRCFPIARFCPVSSKETEGYPGSSYSLTFPCPPAASRKKWGQNGDNVSGAHTLGYQWHQLEEGSRVREHPTRKHGSKPAPYFAIRYQKDGKRQGESLGWASQGMILHKARLALAQLREAARTGNGATRLREQRQKGTCALLPEQ